MPPKKKDIVHSAFELRAFLQTGHQHASRIPKELLAAIEHITSTNETPASLRRAEPASDTASTGSAIDFGNRRGRSKPKEFPAWPQYWALDKTALRKDIKIFAAAVNHLHPTPSDSFLASTTHPEPETPSAASFSASTGQPEIPRPRRSPKTPSAASSPALTGQPQTPRPRRNLTVEIEREPPPVFRKPQLNATHTSTESHTMSGTSGLTREKVSQIIKEGIAAALQIQRDGPPGPPGPPGNNTEVMDIPRISATWKPSEIGLFYPNMPQSWGEGDIIDKDGKNYYRNIHSFTNRVRVAALTRDAKQIRQNLDACLRGEAELWWNTQIDEVMRIGLVNHYNGVEEYCKALERRFKPAPSEAWNKFTSCRYTVEDVRNHRSVTEYVSSLTAAAKGCGQGDNEFGLVIQA